MRLQHRKASNSHQLKLQMTGMDTYPWAGSVELQLYL